MNGHRILHRQFLQATLTALLWFAFVSAYAQTAATVTQISGMVVETDSAGRSRVLAVDSAVAPESVLRTAADSHARLKFADGTQIVLRADTEFHVDRFRFNQAKPEDDSFVIRLIKGGFRQVTGLLAKRNPKAMEIRAATATIGIRGTDFAVRMCESDCGAGVEADQARKQQDADDARRQQDNARRQQDMQRRQQQEVQQSDRFETKVTQFEADQARKQQDADDARRQQDNARRQQDMQRRQQQEVQQSDRFETKVTQFEADQARKQQDADDARRQQDNARRQQDMQRRQQQEVQQSDRFETKVTQFEAEQVRKQQDAQRNEAAGAGVYVLVHDGVVSLAQSGVEIVLVKGEVGFADLKNHPPEKIDSPPPILLHDPLLGRAPTSCTP